MKKIAALSVALFALFVMVSTGFAYDLTGGGYGQVQKARPSIAFVLTTWEKKGIAVTTTVDQKVNGSAVSQDLSDEDADISASKGSSDVQVETMVGTFTEDIWKKIPDNQIVDKFQQQFVKQQFNVKASDMARKIAMAPSLAKTGVNPSDRAAVRKYAEKENVNFIARGEVAVLRYAKTKDGKIKASLQIGVEVIDVNSGEVIAAFSNAIHTVATSAEVARNGGINKAAVVAARTLSEQVMDAWINAADNGSQFTVELRKMKSARSQKIPFEKALKTVVTINSQTQPAKDVVTYAVTFKGSKSDLGMAILEAIGDKPGFDEKSFEGPNDIDGKVVFEFLK